MKLLSLITLTAMLSLSACSHFNRGSCCDHKDGKKEACCKDGKCHKDHHKKHKNHKKTSENMTCTDGSCHKKS